MLWMWSVADDLPTAQNFMRGQPPVAKVLGDRLLVRAGESLPDPLTNRSAIKGLWDIRGTAGDLGVPSVPARSAP